MCGSARRPTLQTSIGRDRGDGRSGKIPAVPPAIETIAESTSLGIDHRGLPALPGGHLLGERQGRAGLAVEAEGHRSQPTDSGGAVNYLWKSANFRWERQRIPSPREDHPPAIAGRHKPSCRHGDQQSVGIYSPAGRRPAVESCGSRAPVTPSAKKAAGHLS